MDDHHWTTPIYKVYVIQIGRPRLQTIPVMLLTILDIDLLIIDPDLMILLDLLVVYLLAPLCTYYPYVSILEKPIHYVPVPINHMEQRKGRAQGLEQQRQGGIKLDRFIDGGTDTTIGNYLKGSQ